MLDIGWSELMVIGVVALVVVGPKELPALLRTVGQWAGKARRMANEFQGQLHEAIREAELDDVKKSVEDLRSLSPTRIVADQFAAITDEVKAVGSTAESEVSALRSGLSGRHGMPDEAGSALGGFLEPSDGPPPVSSKDVEAMIDAAATPVHDLPPPVFDLTPAPPLATIPVATAPVEPPAVVADATPEKKADQA